LRWCDVDFEGSFIRVVGSHTKTQRERLAPLSIRAKAELLRVKRHSEDSRAFPITDFKRSWTTAKRLAGLDDLRFHDLRRTAITRWIQQGSPIEFAGKMAGHSQLQTTQKHYIATDAEMVSRIAAKIDAAYVLTAQTIVPETEAVN
jgi:integrase